MNALDRSERDYAYFDQVGDTTVVASAAVIVPLLMERFRPASVLDVGCGTGNWLAEFVRRGVPTIHGFDGPWVPLERLKIPAERFTLLKLDAGLPPRVPVDLAMSLEVAEHVSPDVGDRLVEFLCASAPVVFFSAAIPGQSGSGHVNEQYQDYWVERFRRRGFAAFDLVRPVVWTDARVSYWYRQNCLVFADENARVRFGLVEMPFIASPVHPELYDRERDPRNYSIKTIFRQIPNYLARWWRRP